MNQVVLVVPRESLLAYLLGQRRLANVPPDARLISWWIRTRADGSESLALRLEHPSFPPIERSRLPFMRAKFRQSTHGD
jgi:hypothetical protein